MANARSWTFFHAVAVKGPADKSRQTRQRTDGTMEIMEKQSSWVIHCGKLALPPHMS